MMNYQMVNTNQWKDMESHTKPGTWSGYVESACDILETKTDQIIAENVGTNTAKMMVRHLNLGGGFDGFTPAFFLARIPLSEE